jgi:ABC-type branched-subunit amino acid transport system substrate-binding protein
MRSETWKSRMTALSVVVLVATGAAACGTTSTAPTTTSPGGGSSKVPASAMSDHTGITSTSVNVANISTLTGGLFKGAPVGTQAYADYVNSTGGINGRKLHVDASDDNFTGAGNKQMTQSALNSDFALVGSFSLEDNFGGQLVAQNPGLPDVSVTLDPTTNKLPNVFSAVPANGGIEVGVLQYFKKKYPQAVKSVGSLVATAASAESSWAGEKYVMGTVGYKVIYDPLYAVTQTDFTQNVVAMKNAGVKMVFIDQMPQNYASSVLKALDQQNYHPIVVLGGAAYSNALVSSSGGPAVVDGTYISQNTSLYLGQDASSIPAVGTFNHWVNVASPGFKADLFTLYGWLSAELFAQALKNAGSNPSRGSVLQALSKITTFDGSHLIGPTNPAAKTIGNCYLEAQVVNGNIQRLDDPPVTGPTNGYRCDYHYETPPGS